MELFNGPSQLQKNEMEIVGLENTLDGNPGEPLSTDSNEQDGPMNGLGVRPGLCAPFMPRHWD